MNKYNHLSQENHHQIEALLKEGLNQTEIANNIGVHRCTISHELKRNVTNEGSPDKRYRADPTDRRHPEKPRTAGLPRP